MLFNSLDFAVFIPIVFALYWFVSNHNLKLQNALIVAASYVFYGWWDWRFLSLIIFSTLVDYSIGRRLKNEEKQSTRKILLWTSIIVNLGFLGFFKYYNFFLENFVAAFSFFGQETQPNSLNIILPVGISFYTFQTLSYTIDVYKKKLEPTEDFIAFSAFVCFFPQLVAGPIERATNLLPQFYKKRTFEYDKAVDGMRQILWGLFKKVVIADNCAEYANLIFNNYQDYNGSTLLLGAIFFTFQIYGDFSGYSDIAIGTSRLFGFNLMQNFATPYFSRDIAEFWRRWHISLSTWFRDYMYIPLGGSRGGTWMKIRNTFIIFLVSGFWHGANWTFLAWGGLNALYFLPLLLLKRNRTNLGVVAEGRMLPSAKEVLQMGITFFLTVLTWVFFRAESIEHAVNFLTGIFQYSNFFVGSKELSKMSLFINSLYISFLVFVEFLQRKKSHGLELKLAYNTWFKYLIYSLVTLMIIMNLTLTKSNFIYFQF
ncbi:MBOAT family protein [Schleiferiaceae bacterium]|nr:MBOAT family protein [Schleiferiaceae bacterium]